jgi:hypothetical protein
VLTYGPSSRGYVYNVANGDKVNGDKVNGDKVNGDKANGDKVNGDKVNGDKVNGDKVNVKVTLEQATKAQKWSRCNAVLFL